MSKPARIPAFAKPDAPAPKVARQVVLQRVRVAVDYWEQTAKRSKPRIEDIHQLRVWSRRAMAALQLFAPLLPTEPAAELSVILNKARKRAGKARDCDILLKTMNKATRNLLPEALQALDEQRAESAKKLEKSYRKKVRSGEIRELSRALQKPAHAVAGQNGKATAEPAFGTWFQQQLAFVTALFVKQLKTGKPLQRKVHPLRIEGKRVRYALEIGLPSLPQQAGESLYAALETLQEKLGSICDDQALAAQYRELAQGLKPKQRAKLIAAAERHDRQAENGFKTFVRWWQAPTGRKKLLQQLAAAVVPEGIAELASPQPRVHRRKSQAK